MRGLVAFLSKQPRQTSAARAAQRPSLRWLEVEKKTEEWDEEVVCRLREAHDLPHPSLSAPLCLTK